LFGIVYSSCDSFASFDRLNNSQIVFFNSFFNKSNNQEKSNLFLSQSDGSPLETPELKVIQDNTIGGVSTPRVLTPKVLGDVFGSDTQNKKNIVEYVVQPGDSLQSIAETYEISVNTLLWANDITNSSSIKVGQTLIVLPVSGVLYVVKSGDTIGGIAGQYKANNDDVIVFNDLANENDIYIGDILVIPGGTVPKKATPRVPVQVPLANNFFIFPAEGRITQGLHFYNAMDLANKCGTPIVAAASGIVQKAKLGWNLGGGNIITILHSNGVVTYYGHLMTIFVKPGDQVNVGDRIALMGGAPGMAGAGISTGCHVHLDVIGGKNPLSKYFVGTALKY
jgi:murein DD-endopeptidase MepM/ murein hydrolase activator NlpD